MSLILLLFSSCAHFTSLSPGLEPGEFYVVVQRDNPLLFIPINAPQGAVFRCHTTEVDAGTSAVTSCVRLLDALDAERLAGTPGSVTRNTVIHPLTGDKGLQAAPAAVQAPPTSALDGTVATARSLLRTREALIVKEGLTEAQAATVQAQARKEACAMIATVTDRPCDALLGSPAP